MAKPISTRKMNSIVSISIRSISKYSRYCKKNPCEINTRLSARSPLFGTDRR